MKLANVDRAKEANAILLEHGAVFGTAIYEKRHQARWRCRKMIDLLVSLGLQERWDLREHVNRRGNGWAWCIEYDPRRTDG